MTDHAGTFCTKSHGWASVRTTSALVNKTYCHFSGSDCHWSSCSTPTYKFLNIFDCCITDTTYGSSFFPMDRQKACCVWSYVLPQSPQNTPAPPLRPPHTTHSYLHYQEEHRFKWWYICVCVFITGCFTDNMNIWEKKNKPCTVCSDCSCCSHQRKYRETDRSCDQNKSGFKLRFIFTKP